MSYDPNPSYETQPAGPRPMSVHLPVALLAIAFSIFLGAQISGLAQQSKLMRWQVGKVDDQTKALKGAEDQMKKLASSSDRDEAIKTAQKKVAMNEKFLSDVLELAKEDEDTRAVVEKHGIQRVNPPKKEGEEKKEEEKK